MVKAAEWGRRMQEEERVARWPQGAVLVAQSVLPAMGAMLLVPVVPLLQQQFGAMPNANYWIPALLTVPGLCIALLAGVAGWLGDRFGRRHLLIGALAVYGIAGVAPMFLDDFASVFSMRIVLGICEAVIITLSVTMLGDYFTGRARERWLTSMSTTVTLSVVLLLALGGWLGSLMGWRGPFAAYAVAFLIAPVMMAVTWEPARKTASSTEAMEPFPWQHMLRTGAVTLFGSTLFYTLAIQQGLGLSALGVTDPARLGLLSSIASLANPIGTLAFLGLSRLRTPVLLGIEFGVFAAAFVLMGAAHSDVVFAAAAFLGLFGAGLLMPTLITWTMSGLGYSVRGRGMGIFQSLFAFGQFASGLIVPALANEVVGGILPALGVLGWVAGAACLAGFLLSLLSLRSTPAKVA